MARNRAQRVLRPHPRRLCDHASRLIRTFATENPSFGICAILWSPCSNIWPPATLSKTSWRNSPIWNVTICAPASTSRPNRSNSRANTSCWHEVPGGRAFAAELVRATAGGGSSGRPHLPVARAEPHHGSDDQRPLSARPTRRRYQGCRLLSFACAPQETLETVVGAHGQYPHAGTQQVVRATSSCNHCRSGKELPCRTPQIG